jgi:hypothetical protein
MEKIASAKKIIINIPIKKLPQNRRELPFSKEN